MQSSYSDSIETLQSEQQGALTSKRKEKKHRLPKTEGPRAKSRERERLRNMPKKDSTEERIDQTSLEQADRISKGCHAKFQLPYYPVERMHHTINKTFVDFISLKQNKNKRKFINYKCS